MSETDYVVSEVPGVGEVKARRGTSTAELAGAVKYWHDRYQNEANTPFKTGFLSGLTLSGFAFLLGHVVYYLWSK